MCGKLVYLLSLALLLGILTYQANASYPYLQDSGPDGIVSMEAENFDNNVSQGFHSWTLVTLPAGASGSKTMQALPNWNIRWRDPYGDNGYLALSPRLDFNVNFVKTGTHYVWIRGYASSGSDDDCHVGLNYQATSTGEQISFFNEAANWYWSNTSVKDLKHPISAVLNVLNAGVNTVNIWMCNDGAIIDKIVLTTNPAYIPSGKGPEESIYLVVDDFEDYNATNKIFETWIPNSGTGAGIGHTTSPYVEWTTFYGGHQSMPYYYDNNKTGKAYYSEAEADTTKLGIGSDWIKEGVKALALHFYGDPGNDANATEQMYVVLKDNDSAAVVYYDGNSNDVRDPNWHEWNIRLRDFTDINNVKKVYIGFGNRDIHPTPGGSGLVYFDDIRLYPPRCVPSRAKPAGDFNNDCLADYADLEIMRVHWLNDYQFEDFALLANSWLEEILWP
jgi:hypothetical protein